MKKFTVMDVIIIAVAAAVIAAGAYVLAPKFIDRAEGGKVECTVLISSGEWELAEAMQVGDTVTMSLTEKDGGVITGIDARPAEKTVFDSISGTYVTNELDNKCDIYVTVEADAKVSDTAVTMGSTVLKVGDETPVRGKGYAAMGYTIAIND